MPDSYFAQPLAGTDPEIARLIGAEATRQRDELELIASENYVSRAVLEAQGSLIANKTVEGYPGARYHGGAHVVDQVEQLAIQRAKALFGVDYVNVQPHSGSQANLAVFKALLKPGDGVLSMDLKAGGHLSHGAKANLSGQFYDIRSYGVRAQDGLIDHDAVRDAARAMRPRLIVAGASSYPRALDLEAFRAVADEVGADLLVDMAHFAGLVAGGVLENPAAIADVVTTTTYKSLRGARGGLILSKRADLAAKFQAAVFPGVQGSVLLHMVAAKAVGLAEAALPAFAAYASAVQANGRALAEALMAAGLTVVTNGTDTPIVLVDLRSTRLTGAEAGDLLGRANITCNKNLVPGDKRKPQETSGLRFGVSALTTRGFGAAEMAEIGAWIGRLIQGASDDEIEQIGGLARDMARAAPFYA